jgi:hypothetical protein
MRILDGSGRRDEDVIRGLYGDKAALGGKAITICTPEIGRISRGKETRQ